MQLHEVEGNVADLDVRQGFELIYDLLRAYGISNASITRLQKGTYNRAGTDSEVLWKDKVYYRFISHGEDLHAVIDAARHNERVKKQRPRFLIVRNDEQIVAVDTRTGDTLDTRLADLPGYSAFFLPWAGIEKTQLESINYADVKAAEKMARLYDEIVKHNSIETADDVHRLNIFFSRLLFCFFAEDTGVFPDGIFTNGIGSLTGEDGSDTARYLDDLFKVLDLEPKKRKGIAAHFVDFGFVNGKLFSAQSASPSFSAKARRLILECGTLNWSVINPDIFGSMMQAVVHPGQRESLGIHYTSVENIMKVIRPLFLDDLQDAFDSADTKAKLTRLHKRISAIKCFDPACGSGNFLVIAYKELRKLEHRILRRLQEVDRKTPVALFQDSLIKLENFYGIEIDDFAHEIATLSLWLAKHQMNVEFKELFGHEIQLIPLRDTGKVVCANAARVDWDEVCQVGEGEEVYLFSNPPYLGARLQDPTQKADLQGLQGFGSVSNSLDYVAAWFLLGALYVARHEAVLGFVSTNSICQGDQVALLWPHLYDLGVDIAFGVQSFKWTNNARGNAGVTCVVVGLRRDGEYKRWLYKNGFRQSAPTISPYLVASSRRTIVAATRRPPGGLPEMVFGTRAVDGGNLIFTPEQRRTLLETYPEAGGYLRRFIGATEFLGNVDRYILFLGDDQVDEACRIPEVERRLNAVRDERLRSKEARTRELAATPHHYYATSYQESTSVFVPRHSSANRDYIPIGYLGAETIVSDAANAIYDAPPWLFALLTSRMHNVWARAVCGRIKTDFRYSATLCYNTFPVPALSDKSRGLLTERAFAVLAVREQHSDKTLAQLYDLGKMPAELREAHQFLDAAVDQLYRNRPFQSDDERLELLFDMYEAATDGTDQQQEELEVAANA